MASGGLIVENGDFSPFTLLAPDLTQIRKHILKTCCEHGPETSPEVFFSCLQSDTACRVAIIFHCGFYGLNCVPPTKPYVEVFILSTSECELIQE